jgi:tRNA nucleotidyltransferase (CCA-adding enzyme)
MCHDLGKATTTEVREVRGVNRITSYGHEEVGVPLTISLLTSMGIKKDIIDKVVPLVKLHLAHVQDLTPKAIRRLAVKVQPSNLVTLTQLMRADHEASVNDFYGEPVNIDKLLEVAEEQHVERKPQPNLVNGNHVMAYGIPQGRLVGEIIKEAYDAQVNGEFTSEEGAEQWLKKRMS